MTSADQIEVGHSSAMRLSAEALEQGRAGLGTVLGMDASALPKMLGAFRRMAGMQSRENARADADLASTQAALNQRSAGLRDRLLAAGRAAR